MISLLFNLDAFKGAGIVGVCVLLARVEVMRGHLLDNHGIGPGTIVHLASGPINRTLGVFGIARGPDAEPDVTGSLRVAFAAMGLIVHQGPDQVSIDPPLELLLGPMRGVVVEVFARIIRHIDVFGVVVLGHTLAIVVGLHTAGVVAHPFPVDLVQVVGLQDHAADNTLAWSHLDMGLDNAKEDVEIGLQGRRVEFLGDAKFGAMIGEVDVSVGNVPDLVVEGLVEDPGVVGSQGRVGRTGFIERIAIGKGLGEDGSQADQEGQ